MKEMMEAIKPTLVSHFKPALLARMTMVPYLPISPEALGELVTNDWSGNIRALENTIERAVLLATGPVVESIERDADMSPRLRLVRAPSVEQPAAEPVL